ncbi:MAG TPA: class III lanthipeptide [Symbiobacteriaceae bacterium]|jgi:hypothetical protein|nr:class III lanthipeptide [Symbiobacteriaceae bacterium]
MKKVLALQSKAGGTTVQPMEWSTISNHCGSSN